jgi:hypothetical protein
VLIAGGTTPEGITSTTEIYDPDKNTTKEGPEMKYPRILHSAKILDNGNVILSGGYYKNDKFIYPDMAELFSEKDN